MDDTTRDLRGLPALSVALRHHLVAIVMSVGLAVGLAGFYVTNLSLTYTSSAVVLLSPAPGNPLTPESASGSGVQLTVAMETEAELVRTVAVRDAVSERLGRAVLGDGESLQVAVPSNTQMLEISITSATAGAAQEAAQGFADGYLAYRAERAETTQQAQIETLQRQAEATDADLRRAIREASAEDTSTYASQEVQLFADLLAQLNNTLSATEAVSTDPGTVINPAVAPEAHNELPAWMFFAAAAVLGLAGGVGSAILLEWRRDLVRRNESAELGVPVYSSIWPEVEDELVSRANVTVHEAYRRLRAAVIANVPRPHVTAVTAVDRQPSYPVAVNLAVVLAEAKFSVLLIATDTRSSAVEHMLGLDPRPGLAEALRDGAPARDLVADRHGISVLTSGLDPVGSQDLTARSDFRKIVKEFRQEYDYVVLDAATAGSADGDASLLAAESVLLVLTPDRTTRAKLSATLERFDRLGIAALGTVKLGRPKSGALAATEAPTTSPSEVTSSDREQSRVRS